MCWFLNWAGALCLDWHRVRIGELARFKFTVEQTPTVHGRLRVGKSVNAVLIAVCEFLRFCASRGFVSADVIAGLSQLKYLAYAPNGFHEGESGQFRMIRSRVLKAPEVEIPPKTITPEQFSSAMTAARTERDRFLVLLLVRSGLRIGEALGLHREDMHLLPTSMHLGCTHAGPHVHVVPRQNNPNSARVKGGRARIVPVEHEVVLQYREYLLERDQIPAATDCDLVLVNLTGPNAGAPMSYSNAKQIVERIGNRCGFRLRPHMLWHTAGTAWTRSGTDIDVVQALLGHASRASTAIYQHPDPPGSARRGRAGGRVSAQRSRPHRDSCSRPEGGKAGSNG
ncbi:tyrosine-type recombinase/integrase [Nocardia sp. CA2R105]|uniref:tyrosine-type recombinase/integrase n=1 Tax=Nocardia coffeae TaxID=2873381 RepID=UPI001CA65371|nr:tyrosine-type recombinase/integrase [Nocardia coffeae]MBY8861228.1 tyrosine-type recombinase/integrase [Nocardia coffeae]